MSVSKKKRTTPENAPSMSEQPSLQMPEQQAFHQHLRRLAQSAVRTVVELVMREELDAFIGAAWEENVVPSAHYAKGLLSWVHGLFGRRLLEVGGHFSRLSD